MVIWIISQGNVDTAPYLLFSCMVTKLINIDLSIHVNLSCLFLR